MEIPADIAALGDDVVELGGASTHWIPAFAHDGKVRKCAKRSESVAVVVCVLCEGKGCEACFFNGLIASDGSQLTAEAAKPQGGEKLEVAPAMTDFEKQVARQGLQNFVNMREATRLHES